MARQTQKYWNHLGHSEQPYLQFKASFEVEIIPTINLSLKKKSYELYTPECRAQSFAPKCIAILASKHGMPSLRASSERQSEHSTSLLEYFIAMYMTTGCHILVRFCGPKEKQNRKLTETQDCCAALDVILLETHGSQTPNEPPW